MFIVQQFQRIISALPTLALATANTASEGSTLSGMENEPGVKPSAVAVTSIVVGVADASPCTMVEERDAAPLPESMLTAARMALSAAASGTRAQMNLW